MVEYDLEPRGATVGLVSLIDVRPLCAADARAAMMPSRSRVSGLFAWVLSAPRRLAPRPTRGQLGLFAIPSEIVIPAMGDECQPRWPGGARIVWSVVFGKHSTDHIFVDLNAEGVSDLLGNPQVAETRIPPLHLDDGRDEFRGRTFRARFAAM